MSDKSIREGTDEGMAGKTLSVLKDRAESILRSNTSAEKAADHVGFGIGVIKKLREIYYGNRGNAAVSAEEKKEVKEFIAKLIRHLSSINLDVNDERAQRYSQILNHYRFAELEDDKSLVSEF